MGSELRRPYESVDGTLSRWVGTTRPLPLLINAIPHPIDVPLLPMHIPQLPLLPETRTLRDSPHCCGLIRKSREAVVCEKYYE